MSFVDGTFEIPGPKFNATVPPPVAELPYWVTAEDYNAVRQALYDLKTELINDSVGQSNSFRPVLRVPGVNQARAICLRAGLRSRGTFGAVNGWFPSGAGVYMALWLRDTYMQALAFPGWFTAAYLRPIVDAFVGSIGGNLDFPSSPAERIELDGSYTYKSGSPPGYGDRPSMDSPLYLAQLLVLCARRGDATVYETHRLALQTAFGSVPLGPNGLIYSNPDGPLGFSVGWGFEDITNQTGELGMVSALQALAYLRLGELAIELGDIVLGETYIRAKNDLVVGLRSLRRSDGWYKPSSNLDLRHSMLTNLVVSEGLCSSTEAQASALTVQKAYRSALLTERGGMRHLVNPDAFPLIQGGYQNGGYWLGEWLMWLSNTLAYLNDIAGASKIFSDATEEILREHKASSLAPLEWFSGALQGADLYSSAGAFLSGVSDSADEWMTIQMSGAVGSQRVIYVPAGHAIVGAEIVAGIPATIAIGVFGADRTSTLDGSGLSTLQFDSEAANLTVYLDNSTGSRVLAGTNPLRGVNGGYIRVAVVSGSTSGDITVRLRTGPVVPFWAVSDITITDSFNFDSSVDYIDFGVWSISASRLRNSADVDGQTRIRTSISAFDAQVSAIVRSSNIGLRSPRLIVRYIDGNNYTYVSVQDSAAKIYDRINGAITQAGADIPLTFNSGVDYAVAFKVVGQLATFTYNTVDYSRVLNRPVVFGRCGVGVGGVNGSDEVQFDELTVTSLNPTQPIPPGMCVESSVSSQVTGEAYPVDSSGGLRDGFGALVAAPPVGVLVY
jgi:hypothetical protein